MDSRFRRLSPFDRVFLRLERPDLPEHVAGFCVLEAAPLLHAGGELDLERIEQRLDRRLVAADHPAGRRLAGRAHSAGQRNGTSRHLTVRSIAACSTR